MRDGDEPGDGSDSDDDDSVIAHCAAQRDWDDVLEWGNDGESNDDEPDGGNDFDDEKGDVDHESDPDRIGRVLRGEVFLFREFFRSSDQGGSSRERWDDAYDEPESEGSAHFPFSLSGEEGRSDDESDSVE